MRNTEEIATREQAEIKMFGTTRCDLDLKMYSSKRSPLQFATGLLVDAKDMMSEDCGYAMQLVNQAVYAMNRKPGAKLGTDHFKCDVCNREIKFVIQIDNSEPDISTIALNARCETCDFDLPQDIAMETIDG